MTDTCQLRTLPRKAGRSSYIRPGADIANVNVLSRPPHLGAGCAYLEDVTAAEFCEEGGHGLEIGEAESLAEFFEPGLI